MLKLQNMKNVFMVLFVLVVCSLLGMALEDRQVIKGLISGFHLNSVSEESNEILAEVVAVNCRLELLYLKRVCEDVGFNVHDAPSTKSVNTPGDQALTEKNVKRALSILHPQKKENLFKCLRENLPVAPVSGEDVNPVSWYQKHLGSLFQKSNTIFADSRRHLAEGSPPAPAPAPSPKAHAPKPSSSKRPPPKRRAPAPADTFFIPIAVPKSSPAKDKEIADAKSDGNGDSSHKTIIAAVVVTATVTFLVATILFFCCRKLFGGGSRFDHKDDRPLLSLSMSDYSVSGSSPKAWATFGNSTEDEKISSQSYITNLSGKKTSLASDGKIPSESASGMPANVAATQASGNTSAVSSSALKPPPGRTSAPGLPPLKPPPGRADPLPPEPPASLRPPHNAAAAPPPPPPKPPSAPPPPPPAKRPGPPPPGPPPPPPPKGKPGPRAPPPPKGIGGAGPPRPPSVSVKAGDADDSASKAKLKPFFWDKVMANPDHSMVWHQIKSGSFQFNEEMIESLFGYAAAENKNEKKKESSSRDPTPQYIQLIDPKKAQNLSILLRALNVTTEEVRDALEEGNELPSELLETLLKMAPTAEEELKLRLFSGSITQLGPAERFLKVLVDIPFAFRRLETLLFMGTLQEEATTVKESHVTLEAACKELRSSRLFLKLLEAVLKTGNRMNDGTYRGGAQAFKLDTLLKLADVKGTDGKTTLLHFVVQEIIRSEGVRAVRAARECKSISSIKSEDLLEDLPDDSEEHYRSLGLQVVSGVGDQLEHVRKAACLDSDSLTGSITKLGNALLKSKNFLNKEMKEVDEGNGFHQALKSFVEHAEGDIMQLLEEDKRIMALVKNTADYFHGSSGKEEGLRLFVIVRDFLIMLEKVCREVKERPRWPTRTQKREPPSRQTSTETPRTPLTPDFRQKLFPAIAERRMDGSSSDDD